MDFFAAADGWKTKGDDDDNNNFGFRLGLNSSFGNWHGIRAQLGASAAGYDFFGRNDTNPEHGESQIFITSGLSRKADCSIGRRVSWGVVWDYMSGHNWGEDADDIDLHQFRYLAGYSLSQRNEVGFWGTFGVNSDRGFNLGPSPLLEPMDQYNIYCRRNWEFGGQTMGYLGLADDRYDLGEFIVGCNGTVPLSQRTSLFGAAHYVIPSTSPGDDDPNGIENSYSEETWNISFGMSWTFGPHRCPCRNAPLLPVADNGTFSVAAPTGGL